MVRFLRTSELETILDELRRRNNHGGVLEVWVTEVVRCRMWSLLERKGVEPDTERLVFVEYVNKLGHLAHRVFEEKLVGASEKRVEERIGDVLLVGRIDLMWKDWVIEFKTYTSRKTPLVRLHHLAQLCYYMRVVGASKGLLVYMSRLRPEYQAIVVDAEEDKALVEEAYRMVRRRALEYAAMLRGEMEPVPEAGPWCNWCPYWRHCRFLAKPRYEFEALRRYLPRSAASSLLDYLSQAEREEEES